MANQVNNPFEDEKPRLVHFEKNESHYEYCRMQMHEINRIHKRTFLCNMMLCLVVCLLAVFRQYVAGFDLLSKQFAVIENPSAVILASGIFQIIIAMIVIVMGYLAWANFRSLNILMATWYFLVAVVGIVRADYLSALIGVVGIVFYFFSLREMQHEESLSQMEGYPDFHEKFDISKSDIVIQTLLAHKGEQRTKSTLFTTDYSLRRKKKKPSADGAQGSVSEALAEELQKHLNEKKAAESQAEDRSSAEKQEEKTASASDEMEDLTSASAAKTEQEEKTVSASDETAEVPEAEKTEEPAVQSEQTDKTEKPKAQASPAKPASAPNTQKKPANNKQGGGQKKKNKKKKK